MLISVTIVCRYQSESSLSSKMSKIEAEGKKELLHLLPGHPSMRSQKITKWSYSISAWLAVLFCLFVLIRCQCLTYRNFTYKSKFPVSLEKSSLATFGCCPEYWGGGHLVILWPQHLNPSPMFRDCSQLTRLGGKQKSFPPFKLYAKHSLACYPGLAIWHVSQAFKRGASF